MDNQAVQMRARIQGRFQKDQVCKAVLNSQYNGGEIIFPSEFIGNVTLPRWRGMVKRFLTDVGTEGWVIKLPPRSDPLTL